MPYVSDAQRRYFNWAGREGKIPMSVVNEWNEASRGKKLPERVKKKATMIKRAFWGGFMKRAFPRVGKGQLGSSKNLTIASGKIETITRPEQRKVNAI